MRKKISVFLSMIIFVFTSIFFVSCKDDQQKYDVIIKLSNNFGQEWIFDPNINSMDYSFKYTGREMTFKVKEYKLPDHPRWKDKWLEPPFSGANEFLLGEILYTDTNGNQALLWSVKERGNYCVRVMADGADWNFRSVRLYVTVI